MEDFLNKHIHSLIENDINKSMINLDSQFGFESLDWFSDELFDCGIENSPEV